MKSIPLIAKAMSVIRAFKRDFQNVGMMHDQRVLTFRFRLSNAKAALKSGPSAVQHLYDFT